jgi:hypothetical protein
VLGPVKQRVVKISENADIPDLKNLVSIYQTLLLRLASGRLYPDCKTAGINQKLSKISGFVHIRAKLKQNQYFRT